MQLARDLSEAGVAVAGWTTDGFGTGINAAGVAGTATWPLVSFLIGVNNQYRGRPLEELRSQFRDLTGVGGRFCRWERCTRHGALIP